MIKNNDFNIDDLCCILQEYIKTMIDELGYDQSKFFISKGIKGSNVVGWDPAPYCSVRLAGKHVFTVYLRDNTIQNFASINHFDLTNPDNADLKNFIDNKIKHFLSYNSRYSKYISML